MMLSDDGGNDSGGRVHARGVWKACGRVFNVTEEEQLSLLVLIVSFVIYSSSFHLWCLTLSAPPHDIQV